MVSCFSQCASKGINSIITDCRFCVSSYL